MPRLANRPPAYRLHKPSGQARVRPNRRDYWLGKFGTPESHEAYARLVAELSSSKDNTDPGMARSDPVALSIAELIERYWEHAQSYYVRDGKPTGEHVVIRAALRPVLKLFGSTLAAEFGPKRLKLVREEMVRLGWSRRYINDSISRVKSTGATRHVGSSGPPSTRPHTTTGKGSSSSDRGVKRFCCHLS
jgi:hypothetical protein